MSPRRQEDPEDFDPKPLRGPGGIPWKSLLGWSLPSFLVLYLLGAVPGLPAPRLSWPGASAANHDGGRRGGPRPHRAGNHPAPPPPPRRGPGPPPPAAELARGLRRQPRWRGPARPAHQARRDLPGPTAPAADDLPWRMASRPGSCERVR